MVVIVILGVLASMVVPNLMGNKEKADAQKATSDIVALEGSLDMYKLDNHRYPTTEQGLQALVTKPEIAPFRTATATMAIFAACRRTRGAMIIFWSARVSMAL
jgi:type II secretion system protein G